jgi:hypothetical protein
VFNNIVKPSNPQYHSEEYRKYLMELESRIDNALYDPRLVSIVFINNKKTRRGNILDLFRLAVLIYFDRVSNHFSGRSLKIDGWINSAFGIISELQVCKQQFPLLVLGCEARTDEQRIIIMDAIYATAKATYSRSIHILLALLQSIWNQDDLQTECEIDYGVKLKVIVNSCETVLSFA